MALTEEQLADIRSRIPARPETDIPMPYEDLVRKILTEGTLKSDRTGTGTISLFGQQMRFDLSKYFPLLTTKTVFFKGLAYELLWFLKGSSNINWLLEHNIPFDRVNDHCPENIKRYGKGSGKIYANIYIDDKNLGGFPGWLRCLEEIERMESAENDQI